MHDAQIVQISHALEQGTDELGGLHLCEARSAHDALEQLATLEHLHDDVDVSFALVQALHANNVRVVHQLQHRDLRAQQPFLLGLDGGLVDDLHGAVHAGHFVHALADNGEAASAELLADHVVVFNGHHVRSVLQGGHPAVPLVLTLAVEHALLVVVVLVAGQVLVHDLEAIIALYGHLLVFQAFDDEARQEDHTLGPHVALVSVVIHAVAAEQIEALGQHVEHTFALLPQICLHAHHRAVHLRRVVATNTDDSAAGIVFQQGIDGLSQGLVLRGLHGLYHVYARHLLAVVLVVSVVAARGGGHQTSVGAFVKVVLPGQTGPRGEAALGVRGHVHTEAVPGLSGALVSAGAVVRGGRGEAEAGGTGQRRAAAGGVGGAVRVNQASAVIAAVSAAMHAAAHHGGVGRTVDIAHV
mmetsp:Transcript_44118/g.76905  ORF Transcript_44118/g.76905 Transcript_44118/m.76905 type:complete len:413 (+) Transcript_44118:478-1716(+)